MTAAEINAMTPAEMAAALRSIRQHSAALFQRARADLKTLGVELPAHEVAA